MNLQQIIKAVNTDIDDTLDNAVLIGWINRALDIASTVDKYEKRITLLFDDNISDYTLPSDLIKLLYVFGSTGEYDEISLRDYDSTGYKRWGNIIGFQKINETSVDLYYYGQYPHLENPTDEPVLPSLFHDLLILYTVARARYQDEQENLEADVMNEFNRRIVEFRNFIDLKRKKSTVKIKTIW